MNMTTEIAPQDKIRQALQAKATELQASLPSHISPDKLINTALMAFNSNDYVQRACATPEGRKSFFSAVINCAQDGLLPDGREAAFVAYKNIIQYMPMVEGLQKTMRNSGEIISIIARIVYANDGFTYHAGDNESIEHVPVSLIDDPGEAVGCYCIIKLKNGGAIREIMRTSEIEKVRKVSRARSGGPWVQWWEEMAKKTVIRRAYKRAPKSADVDRQLVADNAHYDLSMYRNTAANEPNGAFTIDGDEEKPQIIHAVENERAAHAKDIPPATAQQEPYVIHYPGGKKIKELSLEKYADQIQASAAKAGDKLKEFRDLNTPLIMGRIEKEDDDLASRLIDALSAE